MIVRFLAAIALVPASVTVGTAEVADRAVTYRVIHHGYTADDLPAAQARIDATRIAPGNTWSHTEIIPAWTEDCDVEIEVVTTLPELSDADTAPEEVRQAFGALLTAATNYESFHIEIAHFRAEELRRRNCPRDSRSIVDYWLDYDTE